MALEQSSTGHADARADIFALGVVLYEMLTGQMPFRMSSEQLERMEWQEPQPVSQFVGVPAELDLAVRKALARDQEARFQKMGDLAKAIAQWAAPSLAEVVQQLISKAHEGAVSSDESTRAEFRASAAAEVPETPVPQPVSVPSQPTSIGPSGAPERINELLKLLYDGRASAQESAFAKLCQLRSEDGGRFHLLFDFARRLCLWGGLDARVSKTVLTGQSLKMGRSAAEVDLPLADPSISRQHVAFFPLEGAVEVEDLSTRNGTFLNGKRIRREKLSNGDTLDVGSCLIAVHILPKSRTLIVETEAVTAIPYLPSVQPNHSSISR